MPLHNCKVILITHPNRISVQDVYRKCPEAMWVISSLNICLAPQIYSCISSNLLFETGTIRRIIYFILMAAHQTSTKCLFRSTAFFCACERITTSSSPSSFVLGSKTHRVPHADYSSGI